MCQVLPTWKLCAPIVAFYTSNFVTLCFCLTHTCAVGPSSIGCLNAGYKVLLSISISVADLPVDGIGNLKKKKKYRLKTKNR